jgi:DNA-binding transcriptional ArsR family regulator
VCKSHGGGTAASVRAGRRAAVSQQISGLWGISPDACGVSVEETLQQLARNKITDITALRLKISSDEVGRHIGRLTETEVLTEYDIDGTIQSKRGTQETRTKRSGTSVWVQELHKTEMELLQILKLLQEVTGGTEEVDTRRIRMQTAREAARLLKAFPGISVDEVAAEVSKRAS